MYIKNRITGKVIFRYNKEDFIKELEKHKADLENANLENADLQGADLENADLRGAKNMTFQKFPTIKTIANINLYELSDTLTIELMRRDAFSHPNPKAFIEWSQGGECPYNINVERLWRFEEKRKLFKQGNPTMRDSDLVVAICKEKGWKIRGFQL